MPTISSSADNSLQFLRLFGTTICFNEFGHLNFTTHQGEESELTIPSVKHVIKLI
ncbi:hypothetical protein JHK85_009510 [Glycine max]|nr:hypothetical protein JHK85_009510 [Glycine max]KHN08142.1 hypothetical protein glysoja_032326 [Glycine soja]